MAVYSWAWLAVTAELASSVGDWVAEAEHASDSGEIIKWNPINLTVGRPVSKAA